jgi:hypothetical protein
MPSRFNLPHIDISAFASSQDYAGSSAFGNPGDRIREEHGRRLQNELRAVLALADASRPKDDRLPPPTGAIVEVELRRGTRADLLEQKREDIRVSAAKANERNDRTVAVFIPDGARAAFEQIVEDYLNGQLTEDAGNPPNKAKVEAIEAFRTARLETVRFLA